MVARCVADPSLQARNGKQAFLQAKLSCIVKHNKSSRAASPDGAFDRFWGHFVLWIAAGLAYIVVASFALAQPLMAAAFFTLLLGAAMIATGVARIFLGAHLDAPLRTPGLFAGLLTLCVGMLIIAGWPAD